MSTTTHQNLLLIYRRTNQNQREVVTKKKKKKKKKKSTKIQSFKHWNQNHDHGFSPNQGNPLIKTIKQHKIWHFDFVFRTNMGPERGKPRIWNCYMRRRRWKGYRAKSEFLRINDWPVHIEIQVQNWKYIYIYIYIYIYKSVVESRNVWITKKSKRRWAYN